VLSFPPDWTFIFQIFLFLILWTALRRLLFEPNLAVLKKREQRTAGALMEASHIKAEAEHMGEQYKTQLAQAKVQSLQQVETVYREAEEQARLVLEAARTEAARETANMRDALNRELAEARQALDAHIPEFSREIGEKLLGRPLT
jgi:F-type H+-transporting ATPase subunit b